MAETASEFFKNFSPIVQTGSSASERSSALQMVAAQATPVETLPVEGPLHARLEALETRQRALEKLLQTKINLIENLAMRLELQDSALARQAARLKALGETEVFAPTPIEPITLAIHGIPNFEALSKLHTRLWRIDGVRAVRVQNFKRGTLNLIIEGPHPENIDSLLTGLGNPRLTTETSEGSVRQYRHAR